MFQPQLASRTLCRVRDRHQVMHEQDLCITKGNHDSFIFLQMIKHLLDQREQTNHYAAASESNAFVEQMPML